MIAEYQINEKCETVDGATLDSGWKFKVLGMLNTSMGDEDFTRVYVKSNNVGSTIDLDCSETPRGYVPDTSPRNKLSEADKLTNIVEVFLENEFPGNWVKL